MARDRESWFWELLKKIGISSQRLWEDAKGIVDDFYSDKVKAKEKLKPLHKLMMLASDKKRDPVDRILIARARMVLSLSDIANKAGYKKIGDNLEDFAMEILTQLAVKLSPSFAKRLFLETIREEDYIEDV